MSTEANIPACVLVLNGYPDCGKLTVAQKLQAMYGPTRTRLYHKSHLLAAAPDASIDSPQYSEQIEVMDAYRHSIFENFAKGEKNLLIIMTYTNIKPPAEDDGVVELLTEHAQIARARGVPLIFVDLLCNMKTNMQRHASKEQQYFDRYSLFSLRLNFTLAKPLDYPGILEGVQVHHYQVDTNALTADETAMQVAGLLRNLHL